MIVEGRPSRCGLAFKQTLVNTPCYWDAEGVLFAEKDFNLAEHPEIEGVPNLQVVKLMQSFASKEYVTERFAWRHYYWCALCFNKLEKR